MPGMNAVGGPDMLVPDGEYIGMAGYALVGVESCGSEWVSFVPPWNPPRPAGFAPGKTEGGTEPC